MRPKRLQSLSDIRPNDPNVSTLLGQLDLSIGTNVLEVLVPEKKHLALGSVECELVEAFLAELRDLDAADFSTEVGAEMLDPSLRRKEVRFGRVSSQARVNMLCTSFSDVNGTGRWRRRTINLGARPFLIPLIVWEVEWVRGTVLLPR